MELTPDNVSSIVMHCLFKKDEDTWPRVQAYGLLVQFWFHPGRVAERRAEIEDLLEQLPSRFYSEDGDSFTRAALDKNGRLWGEHRSVDELICLGVAIGKLEVKMPMEICRSLSMMPVFSIIR